MLLDKFVEEQIKKLDNKMSTERQAGNIEFAKGVECAKSILVASMSELLLGVKDEQPDPVQKVAPSGWRYAHPNALDDMPEAFLSQLTDNSWKNDALPIFSAPIDEKYTLVIFLDYRDVAMRETQCEYRFSVYKCLREGEDGFDFDEVRETLYDGDDFEKLQTVIAAHAMKFEPVTEGLKS